jgi:hypothetical protein
MPKKDFMYQFQKVINQLFVEDLWNDSSHEKKSSSKKKHHKKKNHSKPKYHSTPTYFTPDSSYPPPPPDSSLPNYPSPQHNHSYIPNQNIHMNISPPSFIPNYDTDSDPDDEDCDCAYHRSLREKKKYKLEKEINRVFHS